jgi:aminotransferase
MGLFDESIPPHLLEKYAPAKWAAVKKGVIPLFAADPDFLAAPEIREAARIASSDGVYSYGESYGESRFREAIAGVLEMRKGIACTKDDIMVTSGVAQAMLLVAQYTCKPGDEAIIFDPVDFLFGASVDAAGAKRVPYRIDKEEARLDVEALKKLIRPKTRLLCLCNPHNPLGRVFTKEELGAIADLVVDHHLTVMNDEIWSDIVYTGHRHVSLHSLSPEIADRTITLQGFSKTFGMAGLHVGYAVATNKEMMRGLRKVSPGYFYVTNTISQAAGEAAYTKCWYWADEFLKHLENVRNYAYKRLTNISGVRCRKPEGTYVLFPDVSSYGLTSEEMTAYLRSEAKVGVVPGHSAGFSYFGPAAEGNIRIVFSTTKANIVEALNRIESALLKLNA